MATNGLYAVDLVETLHANQAPLHWILTLKLRNFEFEGFHVIFSSSQDVCIPDLIKLLDILGDNGVIQMEYNSTDYQQ